MLAASLGAALTFDRSGVGVARLVRALALCDAAGGGRDAVRDLLVGTLLIGATVYSVNRSRVEPLDSNASHARDKEL